MRLGIFSGSFNPPHLSHLNIARMLLSVVDEVWFMPCKNHAYGKPLVDFEHRFQMLKRMIVNEHLIDVCAAERKETEVSTYLILKKVKETTPFYDLHLVMGQDNADNIHRWRNYEKLINEFPCIVIPRGNQDPVLPWYNKSPHQFLKDIQYSSYSSTNARNELAKGIMPDMVHPAVASYILAYNLYK